MFSEINANEVDLLTVFVATISLVVSLFAIGFSWFSAMKSRNASAVSILHEMWKDQREFLANDPKTLVAIDGANALKATAAIWIDAGVSKRLMCNVFFPRYEKIYEELSTHTDNLPDVNYSGNDLLTTSVHNTYEQMKNWRWINEFK